MKVRINKVIGFRVNPEIEKGTGIKYYKIQAVTKSGSFRSGDKFKDKKSAYDRLNKEVGNSKEFITI